MKTFLAKIYVKWNRIFNPTKFRPGPFFRLMFYIRRIQAIQQAPINRVAFAGNSRFQEFDFLINAIPGWFSYSIGGTKLKDWLAKWVDTLAALFMPYQSARSFQILKAIIEDLGGNDFLGGIGTEAALKMKITLRVQMKAVVDNVLSVEVVPLAPTEIVKEKIPNWSEINRQIIAFNQRTAAYALNDFINLSHTELVKDGAGNPEYFIEDGIHYNEKAWPIILREITAKLAERGL